MEVALLFIENVKGVSYVPSSLQTLHLIFTTAQGGKLQFYPNFIEKRTVAWDGIGSEWHNTDLNPDLPHLTGARLSEVILMDFFLAGVNFFVSGGS